MGYNGNHHQCRVHKTFGSWDPASRGRFHKERRVKASKANEAISRANESASKDNKEVSRDMEQPLNINEMSFNRI